MPVLARGTCYTRSSTRGNGYYEPEGIPMKAKKITHERCPSCKHVQPLHPDGGFFMHCDPASGQPCPVNLIALLAGAGAR